MSKDRSVLVVGIIALMLVVSMSVAVVAMAISNSPGTGATYGSDVKTFGAKYIGETPSWESEEPTEQSAESSEETDVVEQPSEEIIEEIPDAIQTQDGESTTIELNRSIDRSTDIQYDLIEDLF